MLDLEFTIFLHFKEIRFDIKFYKPWKFPRNVKVTESVEHLTKIGFRSIFLQRLAIKQYVCCVEKVQH